jgi:hypothetical protein
VRRAEPLAPDLAGGATFGRAEEVLQRHVHEPAFRVGQELLVFPKLAADVHAAPAFVPQLREHFQGAVDVHRLDEADREARGHGRKAVPRREQAAGLVERRANESAVDEPRCGLVLLAERERCAVLAQTLRRGGGEPYAGWIVATAPTARVVVRRNLQRIPPRSKWALKKFSEPDVAIAAEAEISRASVAAATICAKR